MNAVAKTVLPWLIAHRTADATYLVGINGPQGSGKTTFTAALREALVERGLRTVSLSVDDFYFTRAEQVALSARNPTDPYLQQRGYPGTHDVPLGCRVLDELRRRAGECEVPVYEKSAHGGLGDRAGHRRVSLPLDVVLFEGWMLGFRAVEGPREDLRAVNEALRAYHAWHERLDAFVQLQADDYRWVLDWRVEAEARTRAAGKPGLSDEAIRDYTAKFLPAYETYLPGLEKETPGSGPALRVRISRDRNPV